VINSTLTVHRIDRDSWTRRDWLVSRATVHASQWRHLSIC